MPAASTRLQRRDLRSRRSDDRLQQIALGLPDRSHVDQGQHVARQ